MIFIEQRVTGLSFVNIHPGLDAYCDDVNIMSKDVQDLLVVDEAVRKFESLSGAILSRNKKCHNRVWELGRQKYLAYKLSEDCERN